MAKFEKQRQGGQSAPLLTDPPTPPLSPLAAALPSGCIQPGLSKGAPDFGKLRAAFGGPLQEETGWIQEAKPRFPLVEKRLSLDQDMQPLQYLGLFPSGAANGVFHGATPPHRPVGHQGGSTSRNPHVHVGATHERRLLGWRGGGFACLSG